MNSTAVLRPGDTFVTPITASGRFPGRKMRVVDLMQFENGSGVWVDAVPVRAKPDDRFSHSTYRITADGRPLPV